MSMRPTMTKLPRNGRAETPEHFLWRMIYQCERLAEKHEQAAAASLSPRTRETRLKAALVERDNVKLHRQRLAVLQSDSPVIK